MATGMNHELDTLHNSKSAITDGVANQANPGWLSRKLQEKEMILAATASAIVNSTSLSDEDKVDRLIQAVESKLRHGLNPAQIFQEFIKILQSEPALQDLAQKLQTKYECRQIPNSEDDELENDDTSEKSKLIHAEEGRIYKQTQIKQESGSDQPCEIRCTLPRRKNPCIMLTCCYGGLFSLILSAVACIEISLKSENSDLKLRWDIEKGSSGSYSISRDNKLAMEQELVLWLSCFIICTPWILAQYTPTDKWKKLVSLAVYSLFVLVAILYSLKDFECFKIRLNAPALLSLCMTGIMFFHICWMCCFFKGFCLRLFLALFTLAVVMMVVGTFFYVNQHTVNQDFKQDVNQDFKQDVNQDFKQDVKQLFKQHHVNQDIKVQFIRATHTEQLSLMLLMYVLQAILAISAKILAVYDRGDTLNRNLALYLSILGVGSSVLLPSVLLLKVPLDVESLYATVLLLPTNLVLLAATTLVPRLPQNFPACCGDRKWFKAIVVYYGVLIGVRNLLLVVLVVRRTF